MTFEGLVIAILHEQDCKTHYFQEGEERLVRLHQKYRAEAIEQLRNWIAAQVAAEQERCVRVIEEEIGWQPVYYADPERPTQVSHTDLFGTLEVIVAAIRTRAGEKLEVRRND